MKKLLLLAALIVVLAPLQAQVSLGDGNHVLEISGCISSFYNYRVLKAGETDHGKNRFKLRDAQLQLEGRYKNILEYELQADFADLAASQAAPDPENPGLMEASLLFKGIPWVNVRMGYGKLAYSRSSLTPISFSPYWQRAEIVRGSLFSRRDVGASLEKSLWKQRINASAGVYTGLGELSLRGDNDPTGQPEFVGRVDAAWPSRYRYREIDTRCSPVPMFSLGLNGRYTNRTLPSGESFPAYAAGEYNIKVIDGKKYTYGLDASAQYKGISAQFEIHQIKALPADSNHVQFQGTTSAQNQGFFKAGGWVGQLNYFHKSWRSIFSLRYEELNLNDLALGSSKRLGAAYAFQLRGFDSMIKAQYFHILTEESSIDALGWTDQLRIGWQVNFK